MKHKRDEYLRLALVGRPNVGKSTLYNRLTKSSSAIVSNIPGTTRDRKEGKGHLAGVPVTVIDTGGLEEQAGALNYLIQQQVEKAILGSDLILFLIDGREGITSTDQHYARWLRNKVYKALADQVEITPPKIRLAINKTEGAKLADHMAEVAHESLRLGFGEPLLISGAHGDGMAELAVEVIEIVKKKGLPLEDLSEKEKARRRQEEKQQRNREKKRQDKKQEEEPDHQTGKATNKRAIGATETISLNDTDDMDKPAVPRQRRSDLAERGGEKLLEEEDEDDIDDFDEEEDDEEGDVEEEEEDDDGEEGEMAEEEISAVEKEIARNNNFDELLTHRTIQVAIMGRPNVGKSSLLNAILGEERAITGPLPGLTRDSIEIEWTYQDRQFRLVDTAGLTRIQTNPSLLSDIRIKEHDNVSNALKSALKEAKIRLPGKEMIEHIDEVPSQFSEQISEYSLLSALQALRYAQVVVIVVEALQGKFLKLDLQLARKCLEEGRAVMIVANKADLIVDRGISMDRYENQVREHIQESFHDFCHDVPVIACSALERKGLSKLLSQVIALHDSYSKRIPTWILNRWLKELMVTAPTARLGTKTIRVKYLTQLKVRPPAFLCFTNVPRLPGHLEKFLLSRLQKEFSFAGVPIRLEIKKTKGNPVKKSLLRQGKHTRRGIGLGESRGKLSGDGNNKKMSKRKKMGKQHRDRQEKLDERRRRDSRLRGKRGT